MMIHLKRKRVLLKLSFICHFTYFVNLLCFFQSKYTVWYYTSHFNIGFMGSSLSTYVVLNKGAILQTTDNLTLRDHCVGFYASDIAIN